MLGEMTIGRAGKLNAYGSYKRLNPKWSFVGIIGILAAFIILSYYSVIGGWVLNYIVKYATGGIRGDTGEYFNAFISGNFQPIFWHFLFMAATAYIVYKGIAGGIEKYSKVMMPGLLILLIIVIIRSVTLPGAGEGLKFYLKPDFSKLNAETIVAALGQVFFSLSLGMGAMITYGSYLSDDENLSRSAMIVPFMDTAAALLAGFAMLPAVFAFGFEPGQGPGLIFVTVPAVFTKIPFGAIFGLMFFLLIFFAAITSSISLLEVCVSFLIDQLKWMRNKATTVLALICFGIGIPASLSFGPISETLIFGKNFFDLLDFVSSNILLPLGGLMMCIFIGYVWGIDKSVAEIVKDGKFEFKIRKFWTVLVKYIAPIAVIIVFLNAIGIIKF